MKKKKNQQNQLIALKEHFISGSQSSYLMWNIIQLELSVWLILFVLNLIDQFAQSLRLLELGTPALNPASGLLGSYVLNKSWIIQILLAFMLSVLSWEKLL